MALDQNNIPDAPSAPSTALPPANTMPLPQAASPVDGAPQMPTSAMPAPPTGALPATTRPNPQAPSVQPSAPPKSLFTKVLESFAGGPTTYLDKNGVRQEVPMTKKSLTAHILAGALTGIITGTAASANAPADPAGTMGTANRAAFAGGAAGAADAITKQHQQAQQQYDAGQLQKFNTMKRNIELHSAMLNLGHVQHEQMLEALQPSIDLYNQAQAFDTTITDPSKKILLDNNGLTGDQIKQKYAGKFSQADFLPMGTKKMFNSDGTPMVDPDTGVQYEEPIFAVINPEATLPATDEMKEQLKYINPNAAKIPANSQVRVASMLQASQFAQNSTILKAAGDTWGNELAAITGDKSLANINLTELAKTNKTIRDGMKYINNYNHLPVDQMLDALGKDKDAQKAAPGVEGVLAHALGMDKIVDYNGDKMLASEALGLKRKDEAATQKADEEEAQRKRDNKLRLELNEQEKEYAESIKVRGAQSASNMSTPFPNNWKDPKTGTNYDMSHPAMKLVDGSLAPPELSKRATKGSDSYNAIIKQADDYSMAKFGKPFDFEQADRQYKYASQKSTVDTLNLLRSLTGESGENNGGTLAQLAQQASSLGNVTFTDFNQAKNWLAQHLGMPGVPAFQATLLSVADEMGKIMGGGNATVDGIRQAQEILDSGFSNRGMAAAINSVRGAMANRSNSLVGDNQYLTKSYGKMHNPNAPNELPSFNGVQAVKQGVSKSTGATFFMLPTGVVVDRQGRTVDPATMQKQ